MELELPTKTDENNSSAGDKTRFKIRTENLSYKLPRVEEKLYDRLLHSFKREAVSPTTYILKNITCEARAGEISAIAGPSGAGKTTLLEILAGSVRPGRVTGTILVNDHPMNPEKFRRVSGHVTQDDALFPLLTVRETLTYNARLRLHGCDEARRARVGELLRELGLEHVANSRVGSGDDDRRSRGISGGERRRVSIGVDAVHDPAVLLLDEPTSGLDSASAFHVASLLKSMAERRGKTVVLTIHQPGFRILRLFDRVMLLSDGSLLHNGSLASLERRLGPAIPRHVNALEFAIEATESLRNDREQSVIVTTDEDDDVSEPYHDHDPYECLLYANRPLKEVWILTWRFWSNVYRTKQLFASRMIMAVAVGIVLGTIFMDRNNSNSFQTRVGFFAFSLTFLLSSTTEGLPIYLKERRIILRETSRGAYRLSSYVVSNFAVFVPFLFLVSLLYSAPVYWLVGLRRETGAFLYFCLVVWLVMTMSNSFVACVSALVPDFISGTMVLGGLMGAFFLFSGYFIAEKDVPQYWIFVHYVSLFKYPFECFIINEYGGVGPARRCFARLGRNCVLFGDEFLAQKGLRETQKWTNLGVMLGFIIGYRLLCYLILWFRVHRRNRM